MRTFIDSYSVFSFSQFDKDLGRTVGVVGCTVDGVKYLFKKRFSSKADSSHACMASARLANRVKEAGTIDLAHWVQA